MYMYIAPTPKTIMLTSHSSNHVGTIPLGTILSTIPQLSEKNRHTPLSISMAPFCYNAALAKVRSCGMYGRGVTSNLAPLDI